MAPLSSQLRFPAPGASLAMLLVLGAALGMMERDGRAAGGATGAPETHLSMPRARVARPDAASAGRVRNERHGARDRSFTEIEASTNRRLAPNRSDASRPVASQTEAMPVRIAPPSAAQAGEQRDENHRPVRIATPRSERPTRLPSPERADQPAVASDDPQTKTAEAPAKESAAAPPSTGRAPANDAEGATSEPASSEPVSLQWWQPGVGESMLQRPKWVAFDLQTILIDALRHSPKIQSVSREASVAFERIVQQDAEFDPRFLLESGYGLTNDPVGNSLVTGGPPRLREESFFVQGGIQRQGRSGTVFDLSQELGLLDSNSSFFVPANQGNARLSLSLTQPLFAGRGRVYNERLLTQARIDSRTSWQEMRGEVETRIAEVMITYWRLYQHRCHLLQQTELLERGRRIEAIIRARSGLDAGRIERSKIRQRIARRYDQWLQFASQVQQQESRLKALIGSETLLANETPLELIPEAPPAYPTLELNLRDAVLRGIENRPDVRAAATQLEAAGLSVRVTRNQLLPQISAVVDSYLAGLNGSNGALESFGDQFTDSGPGVSASLQFELPRGRRLARSRHREALHRFHQKNQELREAIAHTRMEIETALIRVETAAALRRSKKRTLQAAIQEENAVTRRWEMLAADSGTVGTVLEDLLETQQRRTDAERSWVTAQTDYLVALVELQQAMGTLLIREGIRPHRSGDSSSIEFHHLPDDRREPHSGEPASLPSSEGLHP